MYIILRTRIYNSTSKLPIYVNTLVLGFVLCLRKELEERPDKVGRGVSVGEWLKITVHKQNWQKIGEIYFNMSYVRKHNS